ncbi:MAG: polyphosphate kinase 2 [Sphingobacteriales bacterium]|jgi:polyphosphate kinase 2|nr:polyphosphate kinase 2 [Sphingobacteriales bacterium]
MELLDFATLAKKDDLLRFLKKSRHEDTLYEEALSTYFYELELNHLQGELVNLQNWIQRNNKKVAVIFEGRDASGKGGTIRRFAEHLNPRAMRVVALNRPTEVEKMQWYFNRYIKELPNGGEIVFFDRSWYNRAVVEPVMGFCTSNQYETFMVQVPEFEHMLYESGTTIIKLWFDVSKDEQLNRFKSRLKNPLKKWKYSPVDEQGQKLWNKFTHYIDQMLTRTHTSFSPWIIVESNDKKRARLESIRYVLSQFNYEGKEKAKTSLLVDPNIVHRYYRVIGSFEK